MFDAITLSSGLDLTYFLAHALGLKWNSDRKTLADSLGDSKDPQETHDLIQGATDVRLESCTKPSNMSPFFR
jgi:hypothetical protein